MEVIIKGDEIEIADLIKELRRSQDIQETIIKNFDGSIGKKRILIN